MDFISFMFSPFSYPWVLAGGTLIFFLLGWLWYNLISPIGQIWTQYFPMPSKDQMPRWWPIAIMLLFQLFLGFIVTHTVMVIWIILGDSTLSFPIFGSCEWMACSTSIQSHIGGLFKTLIILKIYLGFVLIKDLGHWYFEKKPFALVLIGVGYYLVGILGVCGLLTYFL